MKNFKDITLSIFAIIGFISIITAFNTQPQQSQEPKINLGTPESHVWEVISSYALDKGARYQEYAIMNKQTGQVILVSWSSKAQEFLYN